MSIEYHHRSIPLIDSDDIFDADLDYLMESVTDPEHRELLRDVQEKQPVLFRRLLRHAVAEARGDSATQDKLVNFGLYVLEIIGRSLEHEEPTEV